MYKHLLFTTLSLAALLSSGVTPSAYAAETAAKTAPNQTNYIPPKDAFAEAFINGKAFLDMRYRYEMVHQDGITNDAMANTLRTIVGFQTAPLHGFTATMAALNVAQFAGDSYNDGYNNKTAYPRVGDPADTQLHLAHLGYTGIADTKLSFGRQYLSLDNQRFVGAPKWRQIPQTFDAATITNTSLKDTELFYAYAFRQNRSPGTNGTDGTYDINTHLFHASYSGIKGLKASAYSYLANIKNTPLQSSATNGLRLEYKTPVSGSWGLLANGEYARQFSYANNTDTFGLNYYNLEAGVTYDKVTAKLGHEVLGGDGRRAVQTPMASLHAMNGWADKFSTTPNNGLIDTSLSLGYTFKLPVSFLDDTKVEGQWHTYHADATSAHYGNEYGIDLVQNIAKNYAIGLNYEDYRADRLNTNTRKFILTGQMKF